MTHKTIALTPTPTQAKEFRVEIKVKNNLLLGAMERAGFRTASAFAAASGVSQIHVGKYLNIKKAPMFSNGAWLPSALKMAKCLRTLPEELFPRAYLRDVLTQNRVVQEYSAEEIATVMLTAQENPEKLLIRGDVKNTIDAAIESLPPRNRAALKMYFGLDTGETMTVEEVGKRLNVSRARVYQLIAKAERLLKHPSRGLSPRMLHDIDSGNAR